MATPELSLGEALAQMAATLHPVEEVETVVRSSAHGRVLATDVVSQLDLPGFDNAAMDGYALRAADLGASVLHEIGQAYAGHPFAGHVLTGTCVRIMTGAPLPDGADTVVMMEDVARENQSIRIERPPPPGANVRRRGEHIMRGSVILSRGRQLDAASLALAAGVGATDVEVRRQLRIGVLSTGDELADPPAALPAAGSYDANRPLMESVLRNSGFALHDLGICADEPQAFASVIEQAFALRLDALVISGGAAQGDADVVRRAGGIRFVALNIRPGRGIATACLTRGDQRLHLLGLPGNAVAAYVMLHLLARPLLLHLAGGLARLPVHLPVPLAEDVSLRGGRIDYRRARLLRAADGRVAARPLPDQGSAMLRTVVDADALIALGPQSTYRAGDVVDAVLLASLP